MVDVSIIVDTIENLSLFDGRFSDLKCINNCRDPKKRQGNFSLIFSAEDIASGEKVVIKIFDPAQYTQTYRLACFDREPQVLQQLLNKRRCLQLKKGLREWNLEIPIGGTCYPQPLKYFVTELLPIDVYESFNEKHALSFSEKINIFKEIVLAVSALHSYEVSHRDLKPDNLRGYIDDLQRVIVAIDLGSAVNPKTPELRESYKCVEVGHPYYAPPEAICGLSGERDISYLADNYAIGCMLFELFSLDLFYIEMLRRGFFKLMGECSTLMRLESGDDLNKWRNIVQKYSKGIDYPSFRDCGIGIPKAILPYMEQLLAGLISFDFEKRLGLIQVKRLVEIIQKIMKNQKYQDEVLRRKRLYKKRKQSFVGIACHPLIERHS